jgi:hypothetical protein
MADFSHCVRARRSRPAGESLSFAGSNESNQSKEPNAIWLVDVAANYANQLFSSVVHGPRIGQGESTECRPGISTIRSVAHAAASAKSFVRGSVATCSSQMCLQALFFGYFLLGQQKKVTAGRAHRRALTQ